MLANRLRKHWTASRLRFTRSTRFWVPTHTGESSTESGRPFIVPTSHRLSIHIIQCVLLQHLANLPQNLGRPFVVSHESSPQYTHYKCVLAIALSCLLLSQLSKSTIGCRGTSIRRTANCLVFLNALVTTVQDYYWLQNN